MGTHNIIYVIYDGECPLCQFGVKRISIAGLELLDARTEQSHPVITEIKNRSWNLDEGMVAVIGSKYYFGREAMHVLSCMSTSSTGFNYFMMTLFRSKFFCRVVYPFFQWGRRVALWTKSVPLINVNS